MHRTPVVKTGKENLLLPQINAHRIGQRDQGLRNNGAAIMGQNAASAHNLASYRGEDGVRNSLNLQKKYAQQNDYQGSGSRQYIKGAYYNVDDPILVASPRQSSFEDNSTSRIAPVRNLGLHQNALPTKYDRNNMAGQSPRPEMFMATPVSNY